MKACEICHKQSATVEVKQFQNGVLRDLNLCENCAGKLGIQSPEALASSLLDGFGKGREKRSPDDEQTCPGCQMRLVDFRRTSRLGCASCYEAFAAHLEPMLESMHENLTYLGKVPAREVHVSRVEELRDKLAGAVASEDYELAASLRDQIQELVDESFVTHEGK